MENITLTFEVPDNTTAEILNYVALGMNYPAQVEDFETGQSIPNPQTKSEFVKSRVATLLKTYYKNGKEKEVSDIAVESVQPDIGNISIN